MARPKNPDRIPRENLITRTVQLVEVKFRYVPTGGNEILTDSIKVFGNVQTAQRKATAIAKERGTLLDAVEVVGASEKLYGMSLEKFIENADVLEDETEDKE